MHHTSNVHLYQPGFEHIFNKLLYMVVSFQAYSKPWKTYELILTTEKHYSENVLDIPKGKIWLENASSLLLFGL